MNDVPPGRPADITSIEPHQRGRLPITLAAEAVAIGHQSLDCEARQLSQAAEVLEVRRERGEPAVLEEVAEPGFDACGIPQ